jgi:signal transduction histidine kinase
VDMLLANDMEIIIPLRLRSHTIGVITLGKKESKDVYNTDDLAFLEIISSQSAIAVNNALSYEEIKNFSKKLQLEVEKATEGLIQANARLKQLDEAKSEFVSIASHQLRTPLTVIKGYVSMILEGNFGRINNSQKDSMEKVFASNERLIHLVENLLNISRIESGRLHFNFETTRLENLVGSVVDELKTYAKKKGLKYKFVKSRKKLQKTKIDQEKMRQVILNLIDNAIKYTKKGGITISLSEEDDNLKICVEDTGMGIKTEDLSDLFEKFSRGTGTALIDTEGTGLGLFVADQMVKAHKGKIWAESKGTGKGSRFCFTLPITDKDPIDQ